jgi:L-arabinose isomerase
VPFRREAGGRRPRLEKSGGAIVKALGQYEVWLATGGQELYGEATLSQVDEHSLEVARCLDEAEAIPVRVIHKPAVTSPESVRRLCLEANAADDCVGVIAWMHTFSPAKMWISGLGALQKPLLHLHTQFNRDLPWGEIDMDFMNLNQSAHGDREFGFIETRMRLRRKTVVGHWSDPSVQERIGTWSRAACGWHEAQTLSVARFGDNMRQVAVTEGDKVEAQLRLGIAVNGYGVGELVKAIAEVPDATVDRLVEEYDQQYEIATELRKDSERRQSLYDAARIEAGLREFLEAGGFRAFTDTFEDLGDLRQLPGLAAQRLMADGYGFGAEGDWKTAALVRIAKVMSAGLEGGTSFMEDYTYHLAPGGQKVLGAHMLEVCPSIAAGKPSCEIHPLSIGGKADPVRLVFTATPGPAVAVGLLDLGDRFRLVANEVDVVPPDEKLPRLPVACTVWEPRPDLATAAEAWLLAGGPHHTSLSLALDTEAFVDLAEIAGLELLVIDGNTRMGDFKKELRWNQAYFHLARGL